MTAPVFVCPGLGAGSFLKGVSRGDFVVFAGGLFAGGVGGLFANYFKSNQKKSMSRVKPHPWNYLEK